MGNRKKTSSEKKRQGLGSSCSAPISSLLCTLLEHSACLLPRLFCPSPDQFCGYREEIPAQKHLLGLSHPVRAHTLHQLRFVTDGILCWKALTLLEIPGIWPSLGSLWMWTANQSFSALLETRAQGSWCSRPLACSLPHSHFLKMYFKGKRDKNTWLYMVFSTCLAIWLKQLWLLSEKSVWLLIYLQKI